MRLLVTWLINAAALFALPYLMSSVRVASFKTALIGALALGLFIFVINGLLFWAVAEFVGGFQVAGFWPAVGAAILYSLISWALSALILK